MLFVPVNIFFLFLGLRLACVLHTDYLDLTSHNSTTSPADMDHLFGLWPPDKSRSNICSL